MPKQNKPTYDLSELQEIIEDADNIRINPKSHTGAHALGLSATEIVDTIRCLTHDDFYKTMPAKKIDNAMQDVYKTCSHGKYIYIKLQKSFNDKTAVISFKKDENRS